MQLQKQNYLHGVVNMNNNRNNNENGDDDEEVDDDNNILIMHCSMQLMCATTFSKEFSTKILEFYAPETLLFNEEDSEGRLLMNNLYLCCMEIVKDPTYTILFVGLKHSSCQSFNGTMESARTHT